MVAEDERPAGAWHAEWEPLRELARLVAGIAPERRRAGRAGSSVNADAMRDHLALTHGLIIVSQRLAVELAPVLGRALRRRRC